MKYNLKNRPEILIPETGKFAPRRKWCNPEKSAEWFEGFEKELKAIQKKWQETFGGESIIPIKEILGE